MSEPLPSPTLDPERPEGTPRLFSPQPAETSRRGLLFAGAAALLLLMLGAGLLVRSRHASPAALNTPLAVDPYAQNLAFTQIAMSQSTSLSGGTSTFLDGRVRNTGAKTVTAITMQVIFRNDVALAPEIETLPLSLIRTHTPYVDTEPVGAAPLKPGDEAEFRLIFESIPANWNQQTPELRVVGTTTR